MGALGAENTSDKQRTYGGERWLLVTVAVETGLSRRNGIETRIYVHHSLWVALMTFFKMSCFTSSSVRLVFLTTLTWEIDEKMSIKNRFCLQLEFFFHLEIFFNLPDSSSKERVKSIQPVMHVFVICGLKQYSTMFCAHSKCVWGLWKEPRKLNAASLMQRFEWFSLNFLLSTLPASLTCYFY